jgi:hypothetical protein
VESGHVNSRLRQGTKPFRRLAAAFFAVVMVATSFGMAAQVSASANGNDTVRSEFATYDASVPKPCRKAIVPGTVSACSVVTIGVGVLAADAFALPAPNALGDAHWRMGDASLAPQCGSFSPYRPPCLRA